MAALLYATNSVLNPTDSERNLVEVVGIDTAAQRRDVNACGSRSEPGCVNAPMGRRPIAFPNRKPKPAEAADC